MEIIQYCLVHKRKKTLIKYNYLDEGTLARWMKDYTKNGKIAESRPRMTTRVLNNADLETKLCSSIDAMLDAGTST